MPLIYSAGPDGALGTAADDTTGFGYGLQTLLGGWLANSSNIMPLCTGPAASVGSPLLNDASYLDNITNHDLLKK